MKQRIQIDNGRIVTAEFKVDENDADLFHVTVDGEPVGKVERFKHFPTRPIKGTRLVKRGRPRTAWHWVWPDGRREYRVPADTRMEAVARLLGGWRGSTPRGDAAA